jgi:anti-anti-sigma regulatory factor
VDVSEASFIDSSFISNLLAADNLASQQGKAFTLQFGTAPIVKSAITHSGILGAINHAATRDEALGLGPATPPSQRPERKPGP